MENDTSQFLVLQGEHSLGFGVQFHFDDGQRVGGREITLGIPPVRVNRT